MRTSHKTLAIAMSTALLTSGALFAQVKDGNGIEPSGPSNGGALATLPGVSCSAAEGINCAAAIPDNNEGGATSSMDLVCDGTITDVNVGLDVAHTWVGDLAFTVIAPDSTEVTIVDRPGEPASVFGCSGNDIYAVLDSASGTPVETECAAATPTIDGTFSPNNSLSALNGLGGAGTWQLFVTDNAGGDTGNVNDWTLQVATTENAACVPPQDDAVFVVNKNFTDGNTAGVEVTLDCFSGLPITQTQTVSEAQNVEFTVQSFEQGGLDCNLTEADTTGYTASYDDGTVSAVNCSWQNLFGFTYVCDITNSPDPVDVVVSKDWVIEGEGGNILDPSYTLELSCDNTIVGGYYGYGQYHKVLYSGSSNGTSDEDYTAEVIPYWDGGTDCSVSESHFDSAIESSNGCGSLHVEIDQGDSCTITNTVFFEGIPSLNQYGLAVLALLMLSVGFVGFRRFI